MNDRLQNCGFLLKEVTRRYVLRFEVRAREISLNLAQAKTLTRLEKNQGVSQARLAELAEVDAMAMVRILDRMEADGLLERRPDPADRRARCLYLTAKAKPILGEIWRLSEETREELFAGVGKADREVFMSVLEHIHDTLSTLEGKASEPIPNVEYR
jgi:DNA-binding MarR family transcriptional regulator